MSEEIIEVLKEPSQMKVPDRIAVFDHLVGRQRKARANPDKADMQTFEISAYVDHAGEIIARKPRKLQEDDDDDYEDFSAALDAVNKDASSSDGSKRRNRKRRGKRASSRKRNGNTKESARSQSPSDSRSPSPTQTPQVRFREIYGTQFTEQPNNDWSTAASPRAASSRQNLPTLPILKKGARMSFRFSKNSSRQDQREHKKSEGIVGNEGEDEVESEDEDEEPVLRSISPGSDHSMFGDNDIGGEMQEDKDWGEEEEDVEAEEEGADLAEEDRNHSPISPDDDELPLEILPPKKRKEPQGSRAKGKAENFERPLKKRETRRKASQAPTQGRQPLPFEGVRTRQQRLRESQEPESASKAASVSARSLRNRPTLEPITESPTPRTPSKQKRTRNSDQKNGEPPSKRQKQNPLATPKRNRTPVKAKQGASSGPKKAAQGAKQASGRAKSKHR
ncbi:hypothetical protein BKA70DRAFT_1451509 [Coprinopsis sp. MPI-PUGE-AT-0042]|nr:hypothetical protein BKA70DRAFT_1451509 [Coprinopsis sp. MPI-PUGE-AT-0042]